VFLVPGEGADEIVRLHDRLYRGAFSPSLRADVEYVPHITVAADDDWGRCEALAGRLAHDSRPLAGRVEAIELLRIDDGRVESVRRLPLGSIAASFDARAPRYNQNVWHRLCAEQLVGFASLPEGARVLDAGTGTGLAAIAAAGAIGSRGRVLGVDASNGMLEIARRHPDSSGEARIEWMQTDAADLPSLSDESFDAVLCAAALLYMPVATALAEWRRLLRPGGTVAFSSMRSGFPVAGRVFRECAARYGYQLTDPSDPLGSVQACHAVLRGAGFTNTVVVPASIPFTPGDSAVAWESNLGSTAHAPVQSASQEIIDAIKAAFERQLPEEERRRPGATSTTEVLFARGTR
jgi:ubiquinone/menaquinone biosynthesis C-methylase UbiE